MYAVTERFSYDPFSLVVQEDPYPYYRTLRGEFPIYHNAEQAAQEFAGYIRALAAERKAHPRQGHSRMDELSRGLPEHNRRHDQGGARPVVLPSLGGALIPRPHRPRGHPWFVPSRVTPAVAHGW